ncbi:MAG: hypothetical protein ACRD3W_31315, partial [Terriglobales bacterium]
AVPVRVTKEYVGKRKVKAALETTEMTCQTIDKSEWQVPASYEKAHKLSDVTTTVNSDMLQEVIGK